MTQRDLPLQLLDERTVEQFLGHHLPGCNCPAPVMRVHGDLRAALSHLLNVLREQGSIAESPPPTGHIAAELRRYDDHMRKARGLAAGTRRGRLRIVQRLLLHKFAERTVVVGELQPEELRQFIASQLELRGSASSSAGSPAAPTVVRASATCAITPGPGLFRAQRR